MTIMWDGSALVAEMQRAQAEIRHPRITRFEWACPYCYESGPGLMPDVHASRACEATKTAERPAWSEPVTLVRRPFRMVSDVALEAQRVVAELLGTAPHFSDGGGI